MRGVCPSERVPVGGLLTWDSGGLDNPVDSSAMFTRLAHAGEAAEDRLGVAVHGWVFVTHEESGSNGPGSAACRSLHLHGKWPASGHPRRNLT